MRFDLTGEDAKHNPSLAYAKEQRERAERAEAQLARIRRETWEEAARWCREVETAHEVVAKSATDVLAPLWHARASAAGALADEFTRRAEEEGRG